MQNHYSVSGLEEPLEMNVLSLEEKATVGNILTFDHTGNRYRVVWCDEPQPTEAEAGRLAMEDNVTLRVERL